MTAENKLDFPIVCPTCGQMHEGKAGQELRNKLSPPQSSEKNVWQLTDEKINSLQVASVDRLIQRAKAAHYVNVLVRINGKDEVYEADWLKHFVKL